MSEQANEWNGAAVRMWLDRRLDAALDEQARADKRGRGNEDDYDKAAAEEWVCRAAKANDAPDDPQRFAALLKDLLGKDEYRRVGVHDDRRFEREVRSYLRKLAKMTKTNTGFANVSRYQ